MSWVDKVLEEKRRMLEEQRRERRELGSFIAESIAERLRRKGLRVEKVVDCYDYFYIISRLGPRPSDPWHAIVLFWSTQKSPLRPYQVAKKVFHAVREVARITRTRIDKVLRKVTIIIVAEKWTKGCYEAAEVKFVSKQSLLDAVEEAYTKLFNYFSLRLRRFLAKIRAKGLEPDDLWGPPSLIYAFLLRITNALSPAPEPEVDKVIASWSAV